MAGRRGARHGYLNSIELHGREDQVIPAVEIIDSRYRDFKFDLKSVITASVHAMLAEEMLKADAQ